MTPDGIALGLCGVLHIFIPITPILLLSYPSFPLVSVCCLCIFILSLYYVLLSPLQREP
jgi:hypothetical protein